MSDQNLLDEQLVERVQRGDKNAFNLLVKKYQHKVVNLVARYVNNPGDVPDVAQEAFIKAYRALPTFRGESAFYTWLYRIAVNTAKNYLTSQGRRPPSSDVEADEAEYYGGGEALQEIATPENLALTDEQMKAAGDFEHVVDLCVHRLHDMAFWRTLKRFPEYHA